MTDDKPTNPTADALKRALAAKKAAAGKGGVQNDGRTPEKVMTRQAAALNKPAFRRASKRG